MSEEIVKEIIKQVLFNPQVNYPPISYKIEELGIEPYKSQYIDKEDFESYLKRLEKQLIMRLTSS